MAKWLVIFVGFMAISHLVSGAWPRENRLRIDLPGDASVTQVSIEVSDIKGEIWRTVDLHPREPNPRWLECVLSLPPGEYRLSAKYELRPTGELDKNHGGGWTRVGVQHQIRFEGEEHHFPPPDHEAK